MPDAISILEEDHRRVEELFEQYKSAQDPRVVEEVCVELAVHAVIEEEVIYPVLGSDVPGGGTCAGTRSKSTRRSSTPSHGSSCSASTIKPSPS